MVLSKCWQSSAPQKLFRFVSPYFRSVSDSYRCFPEDYIPNADVILYLKSVDDDSEWEKVTKPQLETVVTKLRQVKALRTDEPLPAFFVV